MFTSVHSFRRFVSATGFAVMLAALAIPVALAGGPSTVLRGDQDLDPAIATAIASHQSLQTTTDLRSPDRRDPGAQNQLDPAIATAIIAHQRYEATYDRRSPDTLDTAGRVKAPVATTVTSSDPAQGFNWGRLAIVVGALSLMLLFVGFGGPAALVTHRTRVKNKGSVPAA